MGVENEKSRFECKLKIDYRTYLQTKPPSKEAGTFATMQPSKGQAAMTNFTQVSNNCRRKNRKKNTT